jgi:phage tail sheath protein FI
MAWWPTRQRSEAPGAREHVLRARPQCNEEDHGPNDIGSGIVNIVIGFAPFKPAEFVIFKIEAACEADGDVGCPTASRD